MTKEEILGEGGDACEYGWDLKVIPYDTAKKAMDEYAKSEAIGFAKWLVDGTFDKLSGDIDGIVSFSDFKTPVRLYQLYLQSTQNKQQK